MQHIQYYQAKARHLDTDTQQLTCRGELDDRTFTVDYDKVCVVVSWCLVICRDMSWRIFIAYAA